MAVPQILENLQESNCGGVLFSTVTGSATLLKQDPTTCVFVKTSQNFKSRYFLCNTSKIAASEFIDNSHSSCPLFHVPSFLPYLYVETRGGGGLTGSGFYVGSPPG